MKHGAPHLEKRASVSPSATEVLEGHIQRCLCCFSVGFGSSGGLRRCPGRGSMIQTFHKPRETPPRSFWKAFLTIYQFSSLILQPPLATEWLPKASLLLSRMQHGGLDGTYTGSCLNLCLGGCLQWRGVGAEGKGGWSGGRSYKGTATYQTQDLGPHQTQNLGPHPLCPGHRDG